MYIIQWHTIMLAYWSFGSHEETMLLTVKKETLQNFGFNSNVKLKNDEILNIKDKVEVPNSTIQQSLSLMTAYLSRGLAQS